MPFYKPAEDSEEMRYLKERRAALGGYVPRRTVTSVPLKPPSDDLFGEFFEGTGDREVATTMVFVHLLSKLLSDKELGRLIVPIVPDEARTFGMETLFRKVGIYSHVGQRYEPVDKETLLYYKEAQDGQILEEGITEAGAMSSFIAAGTAYATHGVNMIPFFIFYSMFGFQRIGDLIWRREIFKHAVSCSAVQQGAQPCRGKACNIRTGTHISSPTSYRHCGLMIRALPMSSRSLSATAFVGCINSGRVSFTILQ